VTAPGDPVGGAVRRPPIPIIGTKGEFAAMQKNGPVQRVLLPWAARSFLMFTPICRARGQQASSRRS
jgi:hypothetical protein